MQKLTSEKSNDCFAVLIIQTRTIFMPMQRTQQESGFDPSCIDLILSNRPRIFQNSCAIETGLSDFHKMTLTVTKKSFLEYKPRLIIFRDYRHSQNNAFREDLLSELLNFNIEISDEGFSEFFETRNKHINYHTPCKQKYVRGNHLLFMKSLEGNNEQNTAQE